MKLFLQVVPEIVLVMIYSTHFDLVTQSYDTHSIS